MKYLISISGKQAYPVLPTTYFKWLKQIRFNSKGTFICDQNGDVFYDWWLWMYTPGYDTVCIKHTTSEKETEQILSELIKEIEKT